MDDIVTRLRTPLPYNLVGLTTKELGDERYEAADEIERMRLMLSELANRFSAQEAKHYRIIRSLESERDQLQQQVMSNGH